MKKILVLTSIVAIALPAFAANHQGDTSMNHSERISSPGSQKAAESFPVNQPREEFFS